MTTNINNKKKYEVVYSLQFKDDRGNYKGSKKYIKYFGTNVRKKYVQFMANLYSNIDFEVEHIETLYSIEDKELNDEISKEME